MIDSSCWYALRVSYCRELKVKDEFDSRGVENFIPMHYVYKQVGEKSIKMLVPVVHNLIFVYTSYELVHEIRLSYPFVQFMFDKLTRRPIKIPINQMRHFITVSGTNEEQLQYIDVHSANLKRGDRVRITDGIFKGVEGEYMRIKGDRRVVVKIEGFLAVATAHINPALLEKID